MKASTRSVALVGSLALLLVACGSRADGPTATTAGNGTSTTVPETSTPLSAAELGELFRQALNSGDVAAVGRTCSDHCERRPARCDPYWSL